MQKINFFDDKHEKIIIDTGVASDVVADLIPHLMQQTARPRYTLFVRINCLLAIRPILDRIGGKWVYKNDILPSIYLARRLP